MKINTKKFIRNILICIIAWIIVSLILNYTPGFKRDKFVGITNLIINDEDVTEKLNSEVYVSETKGIYLSINDVKDLFDKNIYYSEDVIVTTSNTKIATFSMNSRQIMINGVNKDIKYPVLKIDDELYLPISELEIVYNIEAQYIEDTDVVVIDKLNSGYIIADVTEKSKIKFKPRLLSKNVGEVNVGEKVSCYYTTSKGWRLIRTEQGILGYVKANMLDNESIVRQDYNDEIKTTTISTSLKDGTTIKMPDNTSTIVIKTLFDLKDGGIVEATQGFNEADYTVWATITNNGLEKYTNNQLKSYAKRNELINTILNYIAKYKLKGININFKDLTDSKDFSRFMIELTPRLRELGITTNVVLNDSFDEEPLIGIVDYLIKEQ